MRIRQTNVIAVVLAAALAAATEASALPIVSINPSSPTVDAGVPLLVDIDLTVGPGEAVGGFQFILEYDPLVLQADSYFTGIDFFDFGPGFSAPGQFDIQALSWDFAGVSDGTFNLVQLAFTPLVSGTTDLTFFTAGLPMPTLSTEDGFTSYQLVEWNGELVDLNPVPEPGTLLLLGSGAAAALVRARRRQAARRG